MAHTSDTSPATNTGFNASQFREAMGPGYQVGTFSDQPLIVGSSRHECAPSYTPCG